MLRPSLRDDGCSYSLNKALFHAGGGGKRLALGVPLKFHDAVSK